MTDEAQRDTAKADRRPLKSRSTGWAALIARAAVASGLTPNMISVIGIGFALVGAWAMLRADTGSPWLYLLGALGIQLRLLCNMIDGMVAVEGGKGSPTGPLYNELPDRIEDSVLLLGFAYGAGLGAWGWLAALLAMATAYVRAVGVGLGQPADFRGPMAKPHRMAALTLACLAALAEARYSGAVLVVPAVALGIIILGTLLTLVRRTLGVAARLRDAA
jgi:phosphatidylglycerophosphate synthase